jgi:hypothetical protein
MRRGLYRTFDPLLGESARVHKSAGDAAPLLSREIYEILDFSPAFYSLPSEADYGRRRTPKQRSAS